MGCKFVITPLACRESILDFGDTEEGSVKGESIACSLVNCPEYRIDASDS